MRRWSWILRVGPTCNHPDIYKMEAGGDFIHKEEKTDTEPGTMEPQAKECQQPPGTEGIISLE